LVDGPSVELAPGDVVIFPHRHQHHMTSGRGLAAPFPDYGISSKIKSHNLTPLRAGGGGVISRFVCGYMTEAAFNRAFKREFGQPPGRYRSDHRNRQNVSLRAN
jgi:Cupin